MSLPVTFLVCNAVKDRINYLPKMWQQMDNVVHLVVRNWKRNDLVMNKA